MSEKIPTPVAAEPLTLTVKQIVDYTVCGLFYDCRYNRQEPEIHNFYNLRNERFENAMRVLVNHYFYRKQSGQDVGLKSLMKKWEKIWFPKEMTAYDMALERNPIAYESLNAYTSVAVAALEHFLDNFSNPAVELVLMEEKYHFQIGPNLRLSGVLDYVVRVGDGYRVIKLFCKRKRPNPHLFEFAAMKMAFERRSARPERGAITYHLYDIASSSKGFIPISQPTDSDIDALVFWAKEIQKSPNFVPRRGFTAYCNNCPFDLICKDFTFPKV